MSNIIYVSDKGFVELSDYNASDLSVVNSARVSFGKKSEELDQAGRGLIKFLMSNHHGTPFEHNSFTFHIKCPIFVAREWFRHRIGSFNELSLRYATPEIEFYLPEKSEIRTQVGKPGAYKFENFLETYPEKLYDLVEWLGAVQLHQNQAKALYEKGLDLGVAREQSRIVFPVSFYTEFYWTVNARSLMNFLSLRNSEYAQKDIRDYAIAVESYFQQTMPVTASCFIDHDRIAV